MFSEELIGYFLLIDGMPFVCTIRWIHRGFHVLYSSFFQTSILTSIFSPMSDWVSDALFFIWRVITRIFTFNFSCPAWVCGLAFTKQVYSYTCFVGLLQSIQFGLFTALEGVSCSQYTIFFENFSQCLIGSFLSSLALYCMGIPLCLLRRVDFIHSHLIFLDHNLIALWRLCQTYVIIIVLFVYIYIIKVFLMDIIIMPM